MYKIRWKNYSQTLFQKIKIERISGSVALRFLLEFVFIECQVESYRSVLKLSCRPIAFISHKGFLENTKRCGTNLPASFSGWYFMKNISVLLTDQI